MKDILHKISIDRKIFIDKTQNNNNTSKIHYKYSMRIMSYEEL